MVESRFSSSEKLSELIIEAGKEVLIRLDETQDKPTSMLWTDSMGDEWRLIIASISIREAGFNRDIVADRITKVMKSVDASLNIPFALTGPSSKFLHALSFIISTGPNDILPPAMVRNNFINGFNTGKNYVYRLSIQ
jgi:hypothetical protein